MFWWLLFAEYYSLGKHCESINLKISEKLYLNYTFQVDQRIYWKEFLINEKKNKKIYGAFENGLVSWFDKSLLSIAAKSEIKVELLRNKRAVTLFNEK